MKPAMWNKQYVLGCTRDQRVHAVGAFAAGDGWEGSTE